MSTSEEKEYYSKVPVFDGKAKSFPGWKGRMRAFGARKKYHELEKADKDGIDIAKISDDLDLTDDAGKKADALRTKNLVAAGYLLDAIDSSTPEDQVVFDIVMDTQNDDYPAGHYMKAWNKIVKKYEHRPKVASYSIEQSYYKAEW